MKIKYLIIAALGLTVSSCSDSFFELLPNDEVTTDLVYQSESDFEIAVNGCYAKLQTQMSFYTEMCEYRSDNIGLNAPTSGTQDRYDIDQFQEVASNGIISDCWANFNNGVYRCNLVLDKIDGANFDATRKAQFKAEAMFIRAYTYFNMYRAWGGVPTTRRVVTIEESLGIGRSSEEQMYEFIAGDLKTIVDNNMLPASYSGKDVGRITSGAAKALLAKVYLTFGHPQEAAAVLESVIGTYELLPNLTDVFSVDNKSNKEIIWAIRFNKTIVSEGHGAWYSITNLTDNNNRTETLENLYEANDLRKNLLEYVEVGGLCVMRKFYDTRDASTQQMGNDFIVLRYADVLLMYAEALNEVSFANSADSPAMKAINEVRSRAGLANLVATDVPDKGAFRKAIMLERQKEFPYEGHRWFDAVRLGGAIEACANDGKTIQEYQKLFPIPTTELERVNNTSLLWQNPGY